VASLAIFISARCFGGCEARRLAAAVAARFGVSSVRLVDLDIDPLAKPACVIAVPAYLLNDQVISFGNPREADLIRLVEGAITAEQVP
jgi:hypothetical protein